MRGPDHYLAGEETLRLAEDLYRNGSDDEVTGAGMLAAAIAQAHFAAASAAATAELDAAEGPGGGSATGRPAEAAMLWEQVLVDDPDPETEPGEEAGGGGQDGQ